ncbi:hypothetical protein ACRRTK_004300 [Alexandromys fortis]
MAACGKACCPEPFHCRSSDVRVSTPDPKACWRNEWRFPALSLKWELRKRWKHCRWIPDQLSQSQDSRDAERWRLYVSHTLRPEQ